MPLKKLLVTVKAEVEITVRKIEDILCPQRTKQHLLTPLPPTSLVNLT